MRHITPRGCRGWTLDVLNISDIELLQHTYQTMLASARNLYGQVTIETDLIIDKREDRLALVVARVATPQGTYNGWVAGNLLDLHVSQALDDQAGFFARLDIMDWQARIKALLNAGVTPDGATVTVAPAEPLPTLVNPTSLFRTILQAPEAATAAPVPCTDCQKPILGFLSGTAFLPPTLVMEMTVERWGVALCSTCSGKRGKKQVVKTGGKRI